MGLIGILTEFIVIVSFVN